ADERQLTRRGRCRSRYGSAHGISGHHPVGRQLAAEDDDETVVGSDDRVLSGEPGRASVSAVGERSDTRVARTDVGQLQRLREDAVRLGEQIARVVACRSRLRAGLIPGSVGRAEQPVPVPRKHEEDAVRRSRHHRGAGGDAITRHENVRTLGRRGSRQLPSPDSLLKELRLRPDRTDHMPGSDAQLLVSQAIDRPDAGHATGGASKTVYFYTLRDESSQRRSRSRQGQCQPSIVDHRIPELEGAGEARFQPGSDRAEVLPAEPARGRERGAPTCQAVVEPETASNVRGVEATAPYWIEEADRRDEMRGVLEQHGTLVEGFANQPELPLLEVAEATVDELRAPTRGTGAEVVSLE